MKSIFGILLACFVLAACDQQIGGDKERSGAESVGKENSDKKHGNRESSTLPDYKTAREAFWRSLYPSKVTSLYCGEVFDSQRRRGYNVEHVFPMSWATNGLKCGKRKQCRQRSKDFNQIEGDLHNLYPARVDINKERSSYRFGVIGGEKREFGRCDFEVDYRARAVEPNEQVRGEVARSMFYMAYQYKDHGLTLFSKQAELLLAWHRADPPSKEELRRNDGIERIQGNRNPFIDKPELLDSLYRQGVFRSER